MKIEIPASLCAHLGVVFLDEGVAYVPAVILKWGVFQVATWKVTEEEADAMSEAHPWGEDNLNEFVAGKLSALFKGGK